MMKQVKILLSEEFTSEIWGVGYKLAPYINFQLTKILTDIDRLEDALDSHEMSMLSIYTPDESDGYRLHTIELNEELYKELQGQAKKRRVPVRGFMGMLIQSDYMKYEQSKIKKVMAKRGTR